MVSDFSLGTLSNDISLGNTFSYTVSVHPSNASNKNYIHTSSSNLECVNVRNDNWSCTSKALGPAWIKLVARDQGAYEKTFNFTVVPIFVNAFEHTVSSGLQYQTTSDFTVDVKPSNASNKNILVESSPNIVITHNSGNSYTMSGEQVGDGWIKITSLDENGYTETLEVEVYEQLITGFNVTGVPETIVNGNEFTFNVTQSPSNANDKTFTVSATNPEGLSITDNGDGSFVAQAISEGQNGISIVANDSGKFTKLLDISIT